MTGNYSGPEVDNHRFVERVGELCGSDVTDLRPVSGGDFATAFRATLTDGRSVFAKTHRRPPPGFFSTEAAGLSWLAEPAATKVATVVGVTDEFPACLVLDWIEVGGQPTEISEASFGRQLAQLHRAGAPSFGRQDSRTTGSQALPNDPCPTWEEFYADRRLRPLAEIAATRNSLPTASIDGLIAVADRLSTYGAVDEPAARLHGDLWAGNRVIDVHGDSWLIDPAAHGGHREFDLAMMQLFGGFSAECFDAYNDVYPLGFGWQARVPLHQLAPLTVHAIKFGGSYRAAVASALASLD